MTKFFQVPILADERVAQHLNSGRHSHWVRCRRLAKIQPYGMRKTLEVSELLPPAVEPGAMPERVRCDYEAALGSFLASRWVDAHRLLARLPSNVGVFLKEYMERRGTDTDRDGIPETPPPDWNGVIELVAK
jgi:adenylate cyclase